MNLNFCSVLLVVIANFLCSVAFGVKDFTKCCDTDSLMNEVNGTFMCEVSRDKRIQVSYGETNYLANTTVNETCLDISDLQISLFNVTGEKIEKINNLPVVFDYKCCPLEYSYNSETHGCTRSENNTYFRSVQRFVKVGLSNCDIIEDISLQTNKNVKLSGNEVYIDNEMLPQGSYCTDKNEKGELTLRVCRGDHQVCERKKCIHKCCPDGQSFINGSKCKFTYGEGINTSSSSISAHIHDNEDEYAIIHGSCKLYPLTEKEDFHLDSAGIFHVYEGMKKSWVEYHVDVLTYCIEHETGKLNNTYFFRCFSEYRDLKFLINRWVMLISCLFLILTILVYLFSHEAKKIFGRTLVSFCLALLLTFSLVVYSDFTKSRVPVCRGLAFALLYMMFCSFTWLNIMCIDIYYTFGSPKVMKCSQQRSKDLNRFVWYSLYGWGFPLILMCITLIFYYTDVLPNSLKIRVGNFRCFIDKGNYAEVLFSSVPISILEICNVVLFIITIRHCLKIKGEIAKMNDTQALKGDKKKFNANKERLTLIIKLSVIMGISYLFEVVSSFYDFRQTQVTLYVELVWDFFNCLQGLFIFLIFICKKKFLNRFERKVGLNKLRKISFSSTNTKSTQVSSVRSKENDKRKFT